MTPVAVIADHDTEGLSPAIARVVTAARVLSQDVDVLVVGHDCEEAASAAARIDGVRQVQLVDHPSLAHQPPELVAQALRSIATRYSALLAPTSTAGKNLLPRLAGLLDVMQVSDVIEIMTHDTFRRVAYAGSVVQTIRSRDAVKLLTVRASAFGPASEQAPAPVVVAEVAVDGPHATLVSREFARSAGPDLATARVVISGGRAFGSREAFETQLMPIARRLNGAIGASRAAVDAGYVASERQVGQTGQTVAPELYIACGISGAVQHIAGMRDSRVVVAINRDPQAPIFQHADFGLVGDVFEVLPELARKL